MAPAALLAALALAFAATWQRQAELRRQREAVQERAEMAAVIARLEPLLVNDQTLPQGETE